MTDHTPLGTGDGTGGPPSGSAGGDLNGSTYPNPVVSSLDGVPVADVAGELEIDGSAVVRIVHSTGRFAIVNDASGEVLLQMDHQGALPPSAPSLIVGQDANSDPTLYVNGGLLAWDHTANTFYISNGNSGVLALVDASDDEYVSVSNSGLAFYGGSPTSQPTVTGMLSSVTDANAKDVLTSIITALADLGVNLVADGTS